MDLDRLIFLRDVVIWSTVLVVAILNLIAIFSGNWDATFTHISNVHNWFFWTLLGVLAVTQVHLIYEKVSWLLR